MDKMSKDTMKLRKTFVSPRVLQTCGVALELNLLGASKEVKFMTNGIETTGQEVSTDISDNTTDWTAVGSDFD
jgi:hypothetical protein